MNSYTNIRQLHPRLSDVPHLYDLDYLHYESPYMNPHCIDTDGVDDGADDDDDDGHPIIKMSLNSADLTAETLKQLNIDPRDYENPDDPDAPDFQPHLTLALRSWVRRIINKKRRSTGCGVDGWSYRALHALFRDSDADDDAAYHPIAEFVVHTLSGKLVGVESYQALTGILRGIAIKKPNGSPRPIGIFGVLMRIAGSISARLYRPQIVAQMHKHDLGLAPGGPEVVAHIVRHLANRPGYVVLSLDLRNAFNEGNTVGMVRCMTDAAPSTRPYLETVYARERIISYAPNLDDPVLNLTADRGSIQGEGLANACYDLLYTRTLTERIRDAGELPEGVYIITVHDDTQLVGRWDRVFAPCDRHRDICYEEMGNERQCAKDVALYTGNDPAILAYVNAEAAKRNMRVSTTGIVVAGIPIGTDAFAAAHINATADGIVDGLLPRIRTIVDESGLAPRISQPPPAQGAHAAPPAPPAPLPPGQAQPDYNALDVIGKKGLLQRLAHLTRATVASRLTHMLRAMPPSLTETAARRVDDAVYITIMHILGHHRDALPTGQLGTITRDRLWLPISMGGLGFTSCEFSRHAAYVASVCNAAPHLNAVTPLMGEPAVGGGNTWAPVFREMPSALDLLCTAQYGGSEPDSLACKVRAGCTAASALQAHPLVLQLKGNLMKHRSKAVLARMVSPDAATPPGVRARLLSTIDRGAGAFLLSTGGHPLLQMHNVAFRDACNMRLCLSVVGMAPPPAAGGLAASYNAQIRTCSACQRPMTSDGCHAMARVGCAHAMTASQWHAPLANAWRGVIAAQGHPAAKLVGSGLEGGHLGDIWELRNPLPAGVAVDADGMPTTGQRGDFRVQLGGEGGTIVVCDTTVTAAVPIAAQPRRAAGGALEPPAIPPRLLSQTGAAAADGQREKFKLYGDRWLVPQGALSPLSYEVHGAASSSTHAFAERVAQNIYPGVDDGVMSLLGGRRAAFISMLRQRTSVALQTANARAIARWRRLAWNTSALVGAAVAPG